MINSFLYVRESDGLNGCIPSSRAACALMASCIRTHHQPHMYSPRAAYVLISSCICVRQSSSALQRNEMKRPCSAAACDAHEMKR